MNTVLILIILSVDEIRIVLFKCSVLGPFPVAITVRLGFWGLVYVVTVVVVVI